MTSALMKKEFVRTSTIVRERQLPANVLGQPKLDAARRPPTVPPLQKHGAIVKKTQAAYASTPRNILVLPLF